jgi:hypothetical protein
MTHLDTDVLAEFRAGLITGRRGARIAAHLAGCARCAALDDLLAGVCSLLASVPAPAMPDRVAQRLDAVLAAEVAQRGVTQGVVTQGDQAERAHGDGASESPAPRRPGGGRGFRLLTLRVLAPAAAVVLLAAGGYGLSRIGLGSSTGSTASTSAGGAARAAPTAAASAAASAKSAARANAPAAGPQGITQAIVVRISHRNFSHPGFKQQVQAELRVPAGSLATEAARAQVRGCVQQVAGSHLVQRVESVHYDGRPATLIVARTGADDTAWIAAPDCSATYRHVLDTTSPSGISGP